MNIEGKPIHGKILKKIREERGMKLKDVAGDVISVQTLRRIEADETSISMSVLEKLWENLGITYLDYFLEYERQKPKSEIQEETVRLYKEQNYSGVQSFLIKILKDENITLDMRREISLLSGLIVIKDEIPLIDKNNALVFEDVIKKDNLSAMDEEIVKFYFDRAKPGIVKLELAKRLIDEGFAKIHDKGMSGVTRIHSYWIYICTLVCYLSRSGAYQEAEVYMKKLIKAIEDYTVTDFTFEYYLRFCWGILAQIYLRQDKKEGVELANEYIKFADAQINLFKLDVYKRYREEWVRHVYSINKTGIDFDF